MKAVSTSSTACSLFMAPSTSLSSNARTLHFCCTERTVSAFCSSIPHFALNPGFRTQIVGTFQTPLVRSLLPRRRSCAFASDAGASASALLSSLSSVGAQEKEDLFADHPVVEISSPSQFEEIVLSADDDRIVLVKFSKSSIPAEGKNLPALRELCSLVSNIRIARVLGDASQELRQLCIDHDVRVIPSFVFFRGGAPIHRQEGFDWEKLKNAVLYYGRNEYPVEELRSLAEIDAWQGKHKSDDTLCVLNVSLNFCEPCVSVYPTVLQLSHKMGKLGVVFSRVVGDDSAELQLYLEQQSIVEAPTFLFYRNGEYLGRYVGSGRGELIGEILRFQGVECT